MLEVRKDGDCWYIYHSILNVRISHLIGMSYGRNTKKRVQEACAKLNSLFAWDEWTKIDEPPPWGELAYAEKRKYEKEW